MDVNLHVCPGSFTTTTRVLQFETLPHPTGAHSETGDRARKTGCCFKMDAFQRDWGTKPPNTYCDSKKKNYPKPLNLWPSLDKIKWSGDTGTNQFMKQCVQLGLVRVPPHIIEAHFRFVGTVAFTKLNFGQKILGVCRCSKRRNHQSRRRLTAETPMKDKTYPGNSNGWGPRRGSDQLHEMLFDPQPPDSNQYTSRHGKARQGWHLPSGLATF